MSVVLRCPSCGTTKASSGECEACHEAQVRYFCTDHTPGLWLDASTCPKCGARFGDPARGASAPAPGIPVRTRPPAPARSPAPARAPATTSAPPPEYSRARPPKATPSVWGSRPTAAGEEDLDPRASRMALLQKILGAAIRARYMPTRAVFPRGRRPGRGAGGCLKSLLLGVVFLFLALASGGFLFGRLLLPY